MNIQDYISSGAVESYVLGLATPEERREFEQLCLEYPELLDARKKFELDLENQAMANAIKPPPDVKPAIMRSIAAESASPVRKMNPWKYVAAASIVLLAGSLIWNFNLQKDNDSLQNEITAIRSSELPADSMSQMHSKNVIMAKLEGTAHSPASFATVYWDTTSHDVYLLINNLPSPPTDQQYQLWALLNGEPIDMGMLEVTQKPLQLYRMKHASAAQAFAITLEKKGGSPKPNGDMYLMGKL